MKMMSVRERDGGANVKQWAWRAGMEAKLSKRVYKGVPDRWRMAAWWTLAEERADRKGKGRAKSADDIMQDYRVRKLSHRVPEIDERRIRLICRLRTMCRLI